MTQQENETVQLAAGDHEPDATEPTTASKPATAPQANLERNAAR